MKAVYLLVGRCGGSQWRVRTPVVHTSKEAGGEQSLLLPRSEIFQRMYALLAARLLKLSDA